MIVHHCLNFSSCGRFISGTFTVADGMVTARSEHGEKTTQVGGSPPACTARVLLRELADEATV